MSNEQLQECLEEVTPLAGVWIEMVCFWASASSALVTPLAGVWIEIYATPQQIGASASLPLRECGLKY